VSPTGSLTAIQAVLMAILQGVTELFPVSSLGNAVVIPHLLGWEIDREAPSYLPFLTTLHLGTAIALAIYFWRDWWGMLESLVMRSPDAIARENRSVVVRLVIGTIPAGLIGLLLEKRLAALFGRYQLVAVFLILNGIVLFVGEWLRRRDRVGNLAELTPIQALLIGTSQAIALLPGFSRSGATMVGGLLVGLTHESAARFSFLLATPLILAAALLELPKLFRPDLRGELGLAVLGGIVAGIVAFASTAFLIRYFRANEVNALIPFGAYCCLLGLLALVAA
jgi:undecaprenyl-diphosphatase